METSQHIQLTPFQIIQKELIGKTIIMYNKKVCNNDKIIYRNFHEKTNLDSSTPQEHKIVDVRKASKDIASDGSYMFELEIEDKTIGKGIFGFYYWTEIIIVK